MIGFAINAAVAFAIFVVLGALYETFRRLGFDPIGKIAALISRRNPDGTPIVALAAPPPNGAA